MTKIVALYSYTCKSGKDATADAIAHWASMENRSFSRAAFADEMKVVCARALGIQAPPEHAVRMMDEIKLGGYVRAFHDRDEKTGLAMTHASGRDFIIGLAEAIRALDVDFWIRHTAKSDADVHVITDMRFQPEVDWVRANGGVVVEIVRPGTTHVNEDRISPTDIDYMIYNDGSLEGLELKACQMMGLVLPDFRSHRRCTRRP